MSKSCKIAKTYSVVPDGFSGSIIEIEGDRNVGLPNLNIVGMATKTVSEARERVRSAIRSSGFIFPDDKITINLAPADQEKEGTYLDLAIALNILILSHNLRQEDVKNCAFIGELSLDGNIRPVRGIINIVETAAKAGFDTIFIPVKNLTQAQLIKNINLIGVSNLTELFLHLKQQKKITNAPTVVKNNKTAVRIDHSTSQLVQIDQISGQTFAKRAIEIAVAGHHNILLFGPPGTGKTMLARSALNLLPPLTPSEQITVTKIHSLVGISDEIITERPFRAPHHTATVAALIGGGAKAIPGDISLAHLGVLFLDELPEYPRATLESLRQPLEDRFVSVTRAKRRVQYPSNFMLIATMNPCPCGYLGDQNHPCTCSEYQIREYRKKLSGPFLDRIDLFVSVDRLNVKNLIPANNPNPTKNSTPAKKPVPVKKSSVQPVTTMHSLKTSTKSYLSDVIRQRVNQALELQQKRYKSLTTTGVTNNASLSTAQIIKLIPLSSSVKNLLDRAAETLNLSARSYFKIIKVARTIADLDGSTEITANHLQEALSFRQKPLEKIVSF